MQLVFFLLLIAFRGLAYAPLVTNLNITYLEVQNENLMKLILKGGKMGLGKRDEQHLNLVIIL
jgi:hypothetical protein